MYCTCNALIGYFLPSFNLTFNPLNFETPYPRTIHYSSSCTSPLNIQLPQNLRHKLEICPPMQIRLPSPNVKNEPLIHSCKLMDQEKKRASSHQPPFQVLKTKTPSPNTDSR